MLRHAARSGKKEEWFKETTIIMKESLNLYRQTLPSWATKGEL
jgi:hypothetical protein